MSDTNGDNKPFALLEDPRESDKLYHERDLRKEVLDSRSIETGDILFDKVEMYDASGEIRETSVKVILATLRPDESSVEFTEHYVPYPSRGKNFLNALNLVEVNFSPTNSEREVSFSNRKSDIPYEDIDDSQPPKKAFNKDIYVVANGKRAPRLESKQIQKIFNSETDLEVLWLSLDQKKELLSRTSEARRYLSENMLDVVENSSSNSDPRLRQLDNLIDHLTTEIYFKLKD